MIYPKIGEHVIEKPVRIGMRELTPLFREWWTKGEGFAKQDFSVVEKAAWTFELAFYGIVLIKEEVSDEAP